MNTKRYAASGYICDLCNEMYLPRTVDRKYALISQRVSDEETAQWRSWHNRGLCVLLMIDQLELFSDLSREWQI